jgi:hypothetical protein
MNNLKQELTQHLPPIFAGRAVDSLTGNAIRWRTIQNLRSQKKIPEECFMRQGARKTLVVRTPFVEWFLRYID